MTTGNPVHDRGEAPGQRKRGRQGRPPFAQTTLVAYDFP